LIAIALTGCAAQQPAPEQSSVAEEQKPLFSSDEEALAAAQAAYANYLEVSDQIARDGGANPERLKGLVTSSQYSNELANYKEYSLSGVHAAGTSSFDSMHISNPDQNQFSTYLCIDVSASRVIDTSDLDVTPPNRSSRWPLVVSFSFDRNGGVYIAGNETWTGTNFC
jgi:hypothetical protein